MAKFIDHQTIQFESRIKRLEEACEQYQLALSQIDYLVGKPNGMKVSFFDMEQDPQGVVDRVKKKLEEQV